MNRLILLALVALLLPTSASADDTVLWLSIGTGLSWFNEIDPDELETLATEGSIRPTDPGSTREIAFNDKGFEIPVTVQFGMRITPNVNLWAMYQRIPYILEAGDPPPGNDPSVPPYDTVLLRAPANVFGGGMDFRLASEGYFSSMILALGLGAIDFDGQDQDITGSTNFAIDGSGILYEGTLMFEIDFARDLKFYPFLAFRYAVLDDTNSEYVSVRNPGLNPTLPEYSISYTGITVGISARFKVWPFDAVDDEPSIFDE